jgi:large subunit ribosomal protein L35
MPKMKTKRAARKRFRYTATGKVRCNKGHKSHILTKKTRTRKRRLRQSGIVDATKTHQIARMLPYGAE